VSELQIIEILKVFIESLNELEKKNKSLNSSFKIGYQKCLNDIRKTLEK